MKSMNEGLEIETEDKKDFTIDDLAILKEDLLNLEKAVDAIKITSAQDGATFDGSYIFDLLEQANVSFSTTIPIRKPFACKNNIFVTSVEMTSHRSNDLPIFEWSRISVANL